MSTEAQPFDLRILVVEDSALDFELIQRELSKDACVYETRRVDTEATFAAALEDGPDVVLCDFNLPQFDAMRALEMTRAKDLYLPFIIVSGTMGEDLAVDALKAGANDYIMKDRLERLCQAVRKAVEWRNLHRKMVESQEAAFLSGRAMEAVSQGIMICGAAAPDYPLIHANSAFTQITGYALEEVQGQNCRFLQGPDTDPGSVARIREALARKEYVSVELLNYRKDGTPFWCHLAISPVPDSTGNVTHFVGIQTDITERKLLEAQFIQSQKMDAIGRLAGGIAHDFNNLLSAIMGYCELAMLQTGEGDIIREDLGEILFASKRAAGLTQQLLAFSRRQLVLPQILDPNAAIREMEKMLRRIIGEDIRFETDLDQGLPPVRFDPGQFGQILLNLSVNARDAMPDGGCLHIRTFAEDSAVVTEITDTGTGMPPEVIDHIFEPFFTTKLEGKGTGLGLSTVYGIVSQAGGDISVQSELGKGSIFRVRIPLVEEGEAPEPVRENPGRPSAGTETILVVDDEKGLVSLICRVLEEKGYKVHATTEPGKALQIARERAGNIDLLVSDIIMPGMNGRQLAETVQADTGLNRVLFLTGYTDERVVKGSALFASAPVLRKPFTPTELAHTVRKILDGG